MVVTVGKSVGLPSSSRDYLIWETGVTAACWWREREAKLQRYIPCTGEIRRLFAQNRVVAQVAQRSSR